MQRLFRLVDTAELKPIGTKTTTGFNRSIGRHGVINPIIVAEVADEDGVIMYEIVDGNRRTRAAKHAGLKKIPAVVLKETTPEERSRLTLIANQLRSANFVTESIALTTLVHDSDAARAEAQGMGITSSKLQGILKKLDSMPDEVRRAMYAGRIPASSATSIAGWPAEVQDRIVALLKEHGGLDSREIDAVKKAYDERHPRPPRHSPFEPPPDHWIDDSPPDLSGMEFGPSAPSRREEPHPTLQAPQHHHAGMSHTVSDVSDGPLQPPVGQPVQPTGHEESDGSSTFEPHWNQASQTQSSSKTPPTQPTGEAGQPSASSPQPPASVGSPPNTQPAEAENQEATEDPHAFVARLDAAMLSLARETRERNLPRSVWIDRAMRAWDLTEPE